MKTLIKDISSLVTVSTNGKNIKRGTEMQDISEIKNGALLFDEKFLWIGSTSEAEKLLQNKEILPDKVISAKGKTVLPGFVDSHTHIVFAGSRSHEFARRLRGVTYSQIAEEGGGILTTVKATRNASIEDLYKNGEKIANSALCYGTTTIEIKSGYGLSQETELKQLRAIKLMKDNMSLKIVPTFLGAHDFPPEYKDNKDYYVDLICMEMIPAVAEEKLASFCDAFVDKGYYTIAQAEKIFSTAIDNGLKIKVHADELACVNAAELAVRMEAISADHLLCISDSGISQLKDSGTIATLLPGTAYFIRMPYAPARKIIDSGAAVALATDCNPGSCFTENIQLILSLATVNMSMTMEESISASTINGAAALGVSETVGSIEPGKYADFIIACDESYTDIFYHFGINHIQQVWINGKPTT